MGGGAYIDGILYLEMDNFKTYPFVVDCKKYTSSEQYFQCQKFKDNDYNEFIRLNSNEENIYNLGHSRSHEIKDNWNEIKVDVMYIANLEKYKQNIELKNLLINTKGKIRVYYTSLFWGCGNDDKGENWNGKILELIREELKENINEKLIKKLKGDLYDYKLEYRASNL